VFQDDFNTLDLSPNGHGNYTWYEGQAWESTLPPLSSISVNNSILTLDWNSEETSHQLDFLTLARDGQHYRGWRYGYFEARLKWPNTVVGAWPAFWMIPVTPGAATKGELDIMEGQGGAFPNTIFTSIHNWVNGIDVANNGGANTYQLPQGVDMTQYHTYGVLWTPGNVTWYFDDQPINSAATYPIFDTQEYCLVLSNQVGADWKIGNMLGVSASDIQVNIDWVRAWQLPSTGVAIQK
jgi:beta-glucanase (GH16 family)